MFYMKSGKIVSKNIAVEIVKQMSDTVLNNLSIDGRSKIKRVFMH